MRQKSSDDRPTRFARRVAYRLVGLQALIALVIAFAWLIGGIKEAMSALLGGVASVLPSLYFARRLFASTSARAAKQIIKAFYIGELCKLALSAGLVLLIVLLIPISILPFITGFVGAQFGFWLAPILTKLEVLER